MKQTSLRIAVAQISLSVGNFEKNRESILSYAMNAQQQGADLVVYPELTVSGYLPEDLLFRQDFLKQVQQTVDDIVNASKSLNVALLIGTPSLINGVLFNSSLLIQQGQIQAHYHKQILPNHSVFDEKRYFSSGNSASVVKLGEHQVGLLVCEDCWHAEPAKQAVTAGAEALIVINASPWYVGKEKIRLEAVQAIAKSNHVPVLYTHLVGTQDEVIFDGASFAVDSQGEISFELPAFEHRLGFCELTDQGFKGECCVPSSYLIKTQSKAKINEKLWSALVLATKDYVRRSGFSRIVLGLSGGIDSALVLAIAVDALGAENVEVLLMPSKFNSYISKEDALALIKNFGVKSRTIPIDEMMGLYRQQIGASQAIPLKDITQENIQARTRGNLLMAISSETNSLVLTTGNKSELATGYCTLYGDMCGAFAVIKDLYKTQVFELATWFNAKSQKQFIPERVINRAPSAELRENQTDQDSLPPYDRLDQILFHLIEKRSSTEDIVQAGFERETVQHIVKLLQNSEFKRKQGALGPKVSSCAFGKDWRYPLLNDFRL